MCFLQITLFEYPGVGVIKQLSAEEMSYHVIAGIGKMNYYYFMMYNLVGGALWVAVFCYAGYFFGDLPFVQENLKLLIVAIIFISVLPAIIEVVRAKLKS